MRFEAFQKHNFPNRIFAELVVNLPKQQLPVDVNKVQYIKQPPKNDPILAPNSLTRVGGTNKVYYRRCANGEFPTQETLRGVGTSFRCNDFWDGLREQALLMIG